MHDCVFGFDAGKLLQQSSAAVVVVLLRISQALFVLGRVDFYSVALGRSRLGPLHGSCGNGLGDLSLAHTGGVFLLEDLANGIGLGGTRLFGSSVIVYPLHMVKKVPAAGKSISRNGSLASWVETKVWVVSVAVESMGFTFMTEEASVGRKVQILSSTSSHLTSIWLQVGVQVFANS